MSQGKKSLMDKADWLGYALDKENDSVAAHSKITTTKRKRKSATSQWNNPPITPASIARTFRKERSK